MQEKIQEFLNEPMAQRVLFFNEMLTPSLIRIAYWLCLLAVLWTGLGRMFSGGFGNFIEGIVFIVTGAILSRIAAELIMVLFKLNEKMSEVASNTKLAAKPVTKPAERSVTKKTSKKTSKKVAKNAG